jgi:hypothetical protein
MLGSLPNRSVFVFFKAVSYIDGARCKNARYQAARQMAAETKAANTTQQISFAHGSCRSSVGSWRSMTLALS